MRIPVFVSCPTSLNAGQERVRELILDQLKRMELEPRALGRSDHPKDSPLREIFVIARHCSGCIVLGFEQFQSSAGIWKQGTSQEASANTPVKFPTPWNHLEAGIVFGLRLPLLVFKEPGISGGIFDPGVTEAFIHNLPTHPLTKSERSALTDVFLKWSAKVREHYYQ